MSEMSSSAMLLTKSSPFIASNRICQFCTFCQFFTAKKKLLISFVGHEKSEAKGLELEDLILESEVKETFTQIALLSVQWYAVV